jgi:hypothetical protein
VLFQRARSPTTVVPGPDKAEDELIANGVRGEPVLLPQTVFGPKTPLH